MTGLERYKRALEEIDAHMERGSWSFERVRDIASAALRPTPEMEDVPLERWAVVAPSGYVEATFSSKDAATAETRTDKWRGYQVACLAGTYQRPKPQPVERSVTVKCVKLDHDNDEIRAQCRLFVTGDDMEQDAINRDLMYGKTGTLTFTWTE